MFFLIALLLVTEASAAAPGRKAPVFRRDDSGRFVRTGEWRAVPADRDAGRRMLDFDMVSRKRTGRKMLAGLKAPSAVEGVIKVVMIRVAFAANSEEENTSIKTSGDFDISAPNGSLIDPTPHDKTYFNAHMEGLRNYIDFQSCGRLEVEWDILPEGDEESYKLSDIADYGPGASGVWDTDLLTSFLYDAVVTVDNELSAQGYPARLSDYDAIILVHAGADLQSDINADSPNDIPSFFAVLGDGDQIPIEGGSSIVTEISVVPETGTQDGQQGSLSSTLAHEFGHVLGLPDLYDTYYGSPIVGIWDQMDSGPQLGAYLVDGDEEIYAVGILPSGLGAWSKYMLGWTETDTIRTFDNDISLSALERCPSRIVRIDISSEEYFLVENRVSETDELYTQPVWDPVSGVIIGWGNCLNCDSAQPGEYEWELVNAYDYLLPTESDIPSFDGGPGLLIWHIDEFFIADRWYSNEVNSRWPFGVSLLEGGGVADLGNPYSPYRWGAFDDAFYAENNSVVSDSTFPSSWSNWVVPSGVRIEDISQRDTLMTFGAGIRDVMASRTFTPATGTAAGCIVDLPGEFRSLVVDNFGDAWIPGRSGSVFRLGSPPAAPPALAAGFDSPSGADGVIAADLGGKIHAFNATTWGYCEGSWPYDPGMSLVSHPAVVRLEDEPHIAVTFVDGSIRLLGRSGTEAVNRFNLMQGRHFLGNIVVEHGEDGNATGLFALSGAGDGTFALSRYLVTELGIVREVGSTRELVLSENDLSGRIAILGGDLDPESAGSEVVIVAMATGRIIQIKRDGSMNVRETGAPLPYLPALQDINGDRYVDLVCTDGMNVYVISPSGANVTGWPRDINKAFPLPAPVNISAPVTTAVSDSDSWVVVPTDAGILFIFDHEGELAGGYPRKISAAIDQPVEITWHEDQALIKYLDAVYNEGINQFYSFRPKNAALRWRRAPFSDIDRELSWTSLWGGSGRTAFAAGSSGFDTEPEDWAEIDKGLVIYPNPSRGDRVGIHFTAPGNGEAIVQVLTLTGELVLEEKKTLSGGEDEFALSMPEIASGIYFCRLVISSGGETVESTRKFAIVK